MQISATTLQAQQTARVAPKASQPTDAAAFAPLNFKQTAKAPQTPDLQAAAPAQQVRTRPGAHLDIKV